MRCKKKWNFFGDFHEFRKWNAAISQEECHFRLIKITTKKTFLGRRRGSIRSNKISERNWLISYVFSIGIVTKKEACSSVTKFVESCKTFYNPKCYASKEGANHLSKYMWYQRFHALPRTFTRLFTASNRRKLLIFDTPP